MNRCPRWLLPLAPLPLALGVLAGAPPPASAQGEPASDCFRRQLRSGDLQTCLRRERAAAERELESSFAGLLAAVASSGEIRSDPQAAAALRRELSDALRRSQSHWRALTASECDRLAPALYTGGTIAPSIALDCWISRLRQRIATLREEDPYGPLWSR